MRAMNAADPDAPVTLRPLAPTDWPSIEALLGDDGAWLKCC
jgi:hypothetical protein